jgi:hypothetical protein
MASAKTLGRCLKCTETIGTVGCKGYKEIFWSKHIAEHQKELSVKFKLHTINRISTKNIR